MRRTWALLALAAWAFMLMGYEGVQRPFVAESFGLDDAGIARLVGVVQLGVLGAFFLLWRADHLGRRWLMLLSLALLPLAALATAWAPGLIWFAAAQIATGAFTRSLFGIVPVVLSEEAPEGKRPRVQAWFGLVSNLGAQAGMLLMMAVLGQEHWRTGWLIGALPLLALPLAYRGLGETARFERARDQGRAQVRLWDVFHAPYTRRASGLIVASTLRGAAVMASLSWTAYHGISNLGLSGRTVAGLSFAATVAGLLGVPLAARLARTWGRRPTVVLGSALTVFGGVTYYHVPLEAGLPALLAVLIVSRIGLNIFNVGDRLVDTELFPTHLRATWTAWGRLGDTVSGVGSNLLLAVLADAMGGLVWAIGALSIACFVPATLLFLWVVPETRGLDLDSASLEDAAATGAVEPVEPRRDVPR